MSVTLKDSNNAAVNLTGYSIASQIWDSGRTTKGGDGTCSISSAANGTWSWTVTDTQTATFTADEYKYDVLLTNGSGDKEYWVEGTITMNEGYTS